MKTEVLKELVKNLTQDGIFEVTSLKEETPSIDDKDMESFKLKIELQLGPNGAHKLFG